MAETNYPNTVGTALLKGYAVTSRVTNATVEQTTSGIAGCGTSTTNYLPCNLAMIDTGDYSDSSFRNGTQWNIRLDKAFISDRLYGTFFRTTLNTDSPYQRPETSTAGKYEQYALQVNEDHTFSANTVNEAAFGVLRLEGTMDTTGNYEVPYTTVTGVGSAFGISQPGLDFIQHNWHWRDVLTHTRGAHVLRFGYEGWFGDDVEIFRCGTIIPNSRLTICCLWCRIMSIRKTMCLTIRKPACIMNGTGTPRLLPMAYSPRMHGKRGGTGFELWSSLGRFWQSVLQKRNHCFWKFLLWSWNHILRRNGQRLCSGEETRIEPVDYGYLQPTRRFLLGYNWKQQVDFARRSRHLS